MICLLVLSLLIAVAGGGMAQTPETADIYAPGRAIVADLDRIVTPNGVQETFEAVLGVRGRSLTCAVPIAATRS